MRIDAAKWLTGMMDLPLSVKGMAVDMLAAGESTTGDLTAYQLAQVIGLDPEQADDPGSQFSIALKHLQQMELLQVQHELLDDQLYFIQQQGQLLDLCEWVAWWNELNESGLVRHGYRSKPLSSSLQNAWRRVKNSEELQELLEDPQFIRTQIEQSDFCRERWFSLEKLFGGRNKSGEYIVQALLRGAYCNDTANQAVAASSLW